MAWNNGFPATYGQVFPQGYPMMQPQMGMNSFQNGNTQQPTQMPVANQAPQMMTPPTIRAEIIQIDDEAAVDRFPLGPGASQMFITRAEDKIIIKTMGQSGPLPLDVYEKRPPEPPAPVFDPGEYVRKDEIEALVSAAIAAQVSARRAARKEEE